MSPIELPVTLADIEASPWFQALSEREKDEIRLALLYSIGSNHGTDGHNRLNLIAKLIAGLVLFEMRYSARA